MKPYLHMLLLCAFAGCTEPLTFTPATTEIVIDPAAPKTTRFAAAELQDLLGQIFGEKPPIVTNAAPGKAAIHVGDSAAVRAAGIDVAALKRDGFRIKTGARAVYIAGRDDPTVDAFARVKTDGVANLYYERGTVFGVYDFLERFAGVRFYFPGELGTILPRRAALAVPDADITEAPDYTVRMVSYFWDGDQTVPEDATIAGRSFKTLNCYRQRFQTESIVCSHGQNGFRIPERFAATKPEYFQLLKDGTRCLAEDSSQGCVYCRQLCQSSGIWDEFCKDIASYLKGEKADVRKIPHWRDSSRKRGEFEWNHNFQRTHGGIYIDVMPQDGMKDCFCEKCQAAYRAASDPRSKASELVWGKTAELANRVAAIDPKVTLVQMAYGDYRGLPAINLPDNILVMVAIRGQWSAWAPAQLASENAVVRGWAEKLGHKVWLWNYPCKVECGNNLFPDIAPMAPHCWGAYYKTVAPWIIGAYAETNCDKWIFNYLNYYVYGKVAWNNKADADALIDEHHVLMFGAKAAPHMAHFFDVLERKWINETVGHVVVTEMGPGIAPPSDHDMYFKVFSPAVMKDLDESLAKAAATCSADSLQGRRIALVRNEFYAPLARRAASYVERHDVARALKRNAANAKANILDFTKFLNAKNLASDVTVEGPKSIRLVSTDNANAYYTFSGGAAKMKPNTRYRFSYFVKCEDLKPTGRGGGATASVHTVSKGTFYTPDVNYPNGTTSWIYVTKDFETGDLVDDPADKRKYAYITMRIRNAKGTAYFDGIRLEEIK